MKLELDIDRFWEDDDLAHEDNCFSPDAPQVALGIRMSDECVFKELGEDGQEWGYTPRERRIELNKRYNEKAIGIVGRSLLSESYPEPDAVFPAYRRIGEVFGGTYEHDGNTEWLRGHIETAADLEKRLDLVEKMNLREFILPQNWESEKRRIFEQYGKKPPLFGGIRGPVTLADSVFGTENMLYLFYDAPELVTRFSDAITEVILGYIRIFIEESGQNAESFQHGFGFADDDCALLTPEMYEQFAFPILKKVFDFAAPDLEDRRHQHSDSAMEHIVPILARLNLTSCNFGPTVTVTHIRRYMKNTRIDGQLAPFTFMRNDEDKIIAEVKRDCEMAKASGFKGLNLTTAGSINGGSLLTSMRTVMAAIQNYGRY